MNKRLKSALMLAAIVGAVYVVAGNEKTSTNDAPAKKETYRLVHAIGDSETVNAKGLSKTDCETRKSEQKIVVATLGSGGSVTCLPESLFND